MLLPPAIAAGCTCGQTCRSPRGLETSDSRGTVCGAAFHPAAGIVFLGDADRRKADDIEDAIGELSAFHKTDLIQIVGELTDRVMRVEFVAEHLDFAPRGPWPPVTASAP